MFKNVAIIVGVTALVLTWGCEKKTMAPPPATTVTVSPVISGSMVNSLQVIGQIKALDKVNLVARVKGFLIKQNFKEGELVQKGTVLFEIEPGKYIANLKLAQANHQKAQADQKNANSDYQRQESLYKVNSVSERVRDNALAKKMECDAMVKACEATIEDAELDLSYTKIIAPFDGRAGLKAYSVGNVVGPESGTLLSVLLIDPINVEFSINEKALLALGGAQTDVDNKEHNVVRIILQNDMEYALAGEIARWDNRVNPATGTIKIEAEFKNPQRILVDGMYVNVIVEARKSPDTLLIPYQAVQQSQGEKFVLTVDRNNVVISKIIEIGKNDGIFVTVTKGLDLGEKIIIEGIQKVRQKQKVIPKVDERYSSQVAAEKFYQINSPQKFGIPEVKTDSKPQAETEVNNPPKDAK